MNAEKLYVCDPEKNKECQKWREIHKRKLSCEVDPPVCYMTKKSEFAKTDESGRPIIAEEVEQWKD